MVEEDPSYFTYGESYDIHCSRHGREADLPIVKFKQLCCTENGHLLNDPAGSRREAVSHTLDESYFRCKGLASLPPWGSTCIKVIVYCR